MKKRVLFVLTSYAIGGTTVSTRNLISVLDKDKYDCTLWVLHPEGILQWMYEGVETIPTCFSAQALALPGWRDGRNWLRRIGAALIRFSTNHSRLVYRVICRYAIKRCVGNKRFDTVVACQEGLLTSFVSFFGCENQVAWVRCDYKRYFESRHEQKESYYNKYNHIVCVAEQACKNFTGIYPELKDRTICIYNPQDSNLILLQSERNDHDIRFKTDKLTIVSLGRLDKVKRFCEIPRIARDLVERGLDFRWYVIGEGGDEIAIKENVKKYDVENHVILLGAKDNPHFYIKKADLYVCLSSSEACPRVINEAKILGTPVVSTDFPTVFEYLEDGINGRISPLERVSETINEVLTDKVLYSRIKKEIDGFSFDNALLLEQLAAIL